MNIATAGGSRADRLKPFLKPFAEHRAVEQVAGRADVAAQLGFLHRLGEFGRFKIAAADPHQRDELRLLVHPVAARKGRRLFDDGDVPYHLTVTATEAFPTGVIRVIYSPTAAPAAVGYDEIKDQVPPGELGG